MTENRKKFFVYAITLIANGKNRFVTVLVIFNYIKIYLKDPNFFFYFSILIFLFNFNQTSIKVHCTFLIYIF